MTPITHVSLHRVAGTELRVVSNVEAGVLPIIEMEEVVMQRYAERGVWTHERVTLFVLQGLGPLLNQLRSRADAPLDADATFGDRPVINVYDLADLSDCHVFLSEEAMRSAGYWGDLQAIRGLLAHEHAHPLSENRTTRLSRRLAVTIAWDTDALAPPGGTMELLNALVDKLCISAPREVYANELALDSGFVEALYHLDRRNLANAVEGIAQRERVLRELASSAEEGNLQRGWFAPLLLVGDMNSYLDLALEVASFRRAERVAEAQDLQEIVERHILRQVSAEMAPLFDTLCAAYGALGPEESESTLLDWAKRVVKRLLDPLTAAGLTLRYRVAMG